MNEKRIAAVSYVMEFYTTIQQLNNQYANYLNILILQKNKEGSLNEAEKEGIKNHIQNTRFISNKAYILSKTIIESTNLKSEIVEKIEKFYNNLNNDFVIKKKDLESFVLNLNKLLVQDIIKELLENSQTFYNKLFGEDNKP